MAPPPTIIPPPCRPSPGALADAVGHCVLVFAFLPALAAVPRWLASEATNPLNAEDLVVLSFLLVRGGKAVLDAFYDGIVASVLTGVIDGVLVCACLSSWPRVRTGARLCVLGALCGAVAACLMLAVVLAAEALAGRERPWGAGAAAFEVGAGLVCGALAVRTAARLLGGAPRYPRGPSESASQ